MIPYSGRTELKRFMREQQCRWYGHEFTEIEPEIQEDLLRQTYRRINREKCSRCGQLKKTPFWMYTKEEAIEIWDRWYSDYSDNGLGPNTLRRLRRWHGK